MVRLDRAPQDIIHVIKIPVVSRTHSTCTLHWSIRFDVDDIDLKSSTSALLLHILVNIEVNVI
jgi:hypothetical protein